jgi:hypothetical protein
MTDLALVGSPELLSPAQLSAWHEAIASVDEVADATDSASPSKAPLDALARLVRLHPAVVVEELGGAA